MTVDPVRFHTVKLMCNLVILMMVSVKLDSNLKATHTFSFFNLSMLVLENNI